MALQVKGKFPLKVQHFMKESADLAESSVKTPQGLETRRQQTPSSTFKESPKEGYCFRPFTYDPPLEAQANRRLHHDFWIVSEKDTFSGLSADVPLMTVT